MAIAEYLQPESVTDVIQIAASEELFNDHTFIDAKASKEAGWTVYDQVREYTISVNDIALGSLHFETNRKGTIGYSDGVEPFCQEDELAQHLIGRLDWLRVAELMRQHHPNLGIVHAEAADEPIILSPGLRAVA